jgi:hypothetical protein
MEKLGANPHSKNLQIKFSMPKLGPKVVIKMKNHAQH